MNHLNLWTKILCVALLFFTACQKKGGKAELEQGKLLYQTHCAACHGASGNGRGPMAGNLFPKPRDLTSGILKFRTTRGPIPADIDMLQTMKVGIPGSSMPGWDLLGTREWKAILAYVKSLSPRLAHQAPGPFVEIPQEPKPTADATALGHQLYIKSGCSACHGLQGHGDGASAATLKDVWGQPILPRDLTRGPLKWGNTAKDIYRTLLLGIPGTPMPSFENTFAPDQLWNLVHYLQSIKKPLPEGYDASKPARNLVKVEKIKGDLPVDRQGDVWTGIKGTPIFLKPLWHEPNSPEWLEVKALHNDKEAVFLIRWQDARMDLQVNQSDAVSLQFPREKISSPAELPFLGLGIASEGIDNYSWEANDPPNSESKGIYENGVWHVLIKRKLPGEKTGYLSFLLWDASLPEHSGPEGFSEWMLYELK